MNISILTIFPELFNSFWKRGIIKKAINSGKLSYEVCSLRDFGIGIHKIIDDKPFGGGCGMVIKPDSMIPAIRAIKKKPYSVIFLSPQGKKLDQNIAFELSSFEGLILLCGRYEGIDERIVELCVDFELSIGDYILSGGEIPSMVLIDSVVRLIPGVLGNSESVSTDTFSNNLLKNEEYTRPREFETKKVPDILLSGDHNAICDWRFENSLNRTLLRRRDLLENKVLTFRELDLISKWRLIIENIIQKQYLCGITPLSS